MRGTAFRLSLLFILGLILLWGVGLALRPLGFLLESTRSMLGTTVAILAETRSLSGEVERVQANLAQLQRQEQLLTEQDALMRDVLDALAEQEALAKGSGQLLQTILETERRTVAMTTQADLAGAATVAVVTENARELGRLTKATEGIGAQSRLVGHQLDRLLIEMEGASENFAGIALAKSAAGRATDRTVNWWQRVWEWFK